jgi:heterodisulfide reductase subunit A
MSNTNKVSAVLVVGAGMAGIQAALDLAGVGIKVYLLDSAPYVGGKMVQLYRTSEDNCAICIATPKILEAKNNPNIEMIPLAELESMDGEAGNFRATIRKHPRYVDSTKCVTCGLCWRSCPAQAVSEYNFGLGSRKAIYLAYAGAVPNIPSIDARACLHLKGEKCNKCAEVCPTDAINWGQKEGLQELQVGAILLTSGIEPLRASEEAARLGYGKVPNVIDNFQMDRLVSIYGPTGGQVQRPSDGKEAQKIAIVQCIGSRKPDKDLIYCSSVCCMHSIRTAMSLKAKSSETEVVIFHNDVMAYSKGHEQIYNEAKNRLGVKFVRGEIGAITEHPQTKDLKLECVSTEGSKPEEESFDLVVLSLGLMPSPEAVKLAKQLGVPFNQWGFPETAAHSSLASPGVFIGGSFNSLSDTPETAVNAESAALEIAAFLAETTLPESQPAQTAPPQPRISDVPPKVGVFVCQCGGIVSKMLNTVELAEYAGGLEGVAQSQVLEYACFASGVSQIQQRIKEEGLNRVVVIACSARSHLPLFQKTIAGAGLNKFLVEMVNARELCAWVHLNERDKAMQRMKDEIRGTVAKVRELQPVAPATREITQRGLVIGGGVAGMVAALSLASRGIPVDLIEKSENLGGNANRLWTDTAGGNIPQYVESLRRRAEEDSLIKVFLGSRVIEVTGRMGEFHTRIQTPVAVVQAEHGAIIVATGGEEYKPEEYMYGKNKAVITQLELEQRFANGGEWLKNIKSAVVLHCVGSRNERRSYCSRICCSQAVKNSLRLKEINAGIEVHQLYRDMRTYFLNDILRHEAKGKGITFNKYDEEVGIDVSETGEGKLTVSFTDTETGKVTVLQPDLLVLNSAVLPGDDNKSLSSILGVPLAEDGFFAEDDYMTLTPVDFTKKGIYLCGLAHGPKSLDESIAQARAAAIRALALLSKERLVQQAVVAEVSAGRCVACLTCVRACPFGVPFINDQQVAQILPEECRGCGVCVSSCPKDAIELKTFTDNDVLPQIEALLLD